MLPWPTFPLVEQPRASRHFACALPGRQLHSRHRSARRERWQRFSIGPVVPIVGPVAEILGRDVPRTCAHGGQIFIQEAATERVEGVGTIDDQSASPVEPIDQGLLLLGGELGRVDLVPHQIGDARPGEQAG